MDEEEAKFRALGLTENCSWTYTTTLDKCLDFYFDILQNTPPDLIVQRLADAWSQDSLLTLKLVFQLRDIRNGKGAKVPFYHCMLWMYAHHPKTLDRNLRCIPLYGYWKDLGRILRYIAHNDILDDETTIQEGGEGRTRRRVGRFMYGGDHEDLIEKRKAGKIGKKRFRKLTMGLDAKVLKDVHQVATLAVKQLQAEQAAMRKQSRDEADARLINLLTTDAKFQSLYHNVVSIFTEHLRKDLTALKQNGRLETTALSGKWAPTIGGAVDRDTHLGRSIAKELFREICDEDELQPSMSSNRAQTYYRVHYLGPLRKAIAISERSMSSGRWSEVLYERVPSVCMTKNKNLFSEHDKERFQEYLSQVKTGVKKIASGALMPHEIVDQYYKGNDMSEDSRKVSELQWTSYVDKLRKSGSLGHCMSICDVSGSMSGTPMKVAIALSMLTAELAEPPFSELVISFSENPTLHRVNQPTLQEKVEAMKNMDWGGSTNLQASLDLVLNLTKENKVDEKNMLRTLFIFSDMEFNQCGGKEFETDYELIKRKFQEAGYQLPGIVFWNLRGSSSSKPVTSNECNVALASGFSGQMMKCFLEKGRVTTPIETMLSSIDGKYDQLEVLD